MPIAILIVAVAVTALLVRRALPEIRRRRAEEEGLQPFELAGPQTLARAPAFAIEEAPAREELPPVPLSMAKIVVVVAVVAGLVAALAWMFGSYLNSQLARMLTG